MDYSIVPELEPESDIILEKINKPWFIPETTNLLEQLVEFRKRKE